jgi:Holliday junction resolvase RusA-like endonuclease
MAERIRKSFGSCHINDGIVVEYNEELPYDIDNKRKFYLFDIVPVSAPRMTQSDRWKTNPEHPDINKRQRPAVTRYFAYKKLLLIQAKQMNYEIKAVIDLLFIIPMPNSWSKKKKERMNGLPCKVKPDTDNLTKAVKDTFCKNDSHIWKETAEKRWGYKGSLIIFE